MMDSREPTRVPRQARKKWARGTAAEPLDPLARDLFRPGRSLALLRCAPPRQR
jgi:hypothetical protein